MAIIKPKAKPAAQADKADAFIAAAPDAAPAARGVRKGSKQQISLTIAPQLLARVDELAARLGQSRAAVINLAIVQAVERGLAVGGEQ